MELLIIQYNCRKLMIKVLHWPVYSLIIIKHHLLNKQIHRKLKIFTQIKDFKRLEHLQQQILPVDWPDQ
jgi:hypothetical protein